MLSCEVEAKSRIVPGKHSRYELKADFCVKYSFGSSAWNMAERDMNNVIVNVTVLNLTDSLYLGSGDEEIVE